MKSSSLAVLQMASRYEGWCVSCGLNCNDVSSPCRYYKVKVLEYDNCHDVVDKLYKLDGMELCESCVLERLEVVE